MPASAKCFNGKWRQFLHILDTYRTKCSAFSNYQRNVCVRERNNAHFSFEEPGTVLHVAKRTHGNIYCTNYYNLFIECIGNFEECNLNSLWARILSVTRLASIIGNIAFEEFSPIIITKPPLRISPSFIIQQLAGAGEASPLWMTGLGKRRPLPPLSGDYSVASFNFLAEITIRITIRMITILVTVSFRV